MMQYVCNKCGYEMEEPIFNHSRTVTISFNGPMAVGEDHQDMHLCSNCTRKFKKWVSGESIVIGESDSDDNHSEFSF